MSSGFVSAGATEDASNRDREWQAAHSELEAERQRKAEAGKQEGGKSLYEVLQQNKAAKQEAFEESIRLKNQFRSLDEDEVEFLDSLLESTRAKEAALKQETAEQLEKFHRQRQEAEKKAAINDEDANGAAGAGSPAEGEQWTIPGRKRRRAKEKEAFPGVKLRKASSSADAKTQSLVEGASKFKSPSADFSKGSAEVNTPTVENKEESKEKSGLASKQAAKAPPAAPSMGLVAYGSDSDDD